MEQLNKSILVKDNYKVLRSLLATYLKIAAVRLHT